MRHSKKREGKFEPNSYDHALNVISRCLLDIRENHGTEAAVGTGTKQGLLPFLHRFMAAYGSPNYFSPTH
jgi:hypothetical protein